MSVTVNIANKELKKHVATIHSSNQLSLVQRKIANALLYNAYANLLEANEHHIHINDLCQLIGYDSHDYKRVKQALVGLISTVIEWNLIDQAKEQGTVVWNASAIIADARIDGPMCTYSYSQRMRELLYCPEMYGRLNMTVQAKFKSSYGLALYENCIRYQGIAQTPWFDFATFRRLMGVGEDKYPVFRDFNKRVLQKAVDEVNQYSSIFIVPQLRKQGRKVMAVQFLIQKHNLLQKKNGNNAAIPEGGLLERLCRDFGLSTVQAAKIIAGYEEAYIFEKISIIESSNTFQQGKIINLAKYLTKALKEDYQPPKSSKIAANEMHRAKYAEEKEKEKLAALRETYRCYQDSVIIEAYQQLSAHEHKALIAKFEVFIEPTVYHDLYLKHGMDNIMVMDRLCDYVRREKLPLLDAAMSFEAFCQQEEDNA